MKNGIQQLFRVKEINPSYDHVFGKGNGWIFVTEAVPEGQAIRVAFMLQIMTGFKHEICKA